MKILITGGCGFIGSNLAHFLFHKNFDVHIIDNLSRHGSNLNLDYLFNQGLKNFNNIDITDFDSTRNLITKLQPDIIIHLAGQVAMSKSLDNPINDFITNTYATINILETIRLYSKRSSFIFSSTNKVYGNLNNLTYIRSDTRYICTEFPNGFDESTPLSFESPYGCSKGSADMYVLDYSRQFGINCSVFRHSSVYGERQFSTYDQGWVGWFIKQVMINSTKNDSNIDILGSGFQVRDLLYITDVTDLYYQAILNFQKINGSVFNIGGGICNSLSIRELILFLDKHFKIKSKIISKDYRSGDQKVFVSNNNKIFNAIGWEPQISLTNGLKKSIHWVSLLS